jgi:hypothetical protein
MLVIGDVFAVRSSNRNYTKAIVTNDFEQGQNKSLTLRWVTYSQAPEAKIVSSGTTEIPDSGNFSFGCSTRAQQEPSFRRALPEW